MKNWNGLRWLLLLVLVCFLVEGRVQGQTAADLTRKLERLNAYPDLIVVNGKFSTMDARLTEAQAMAVKNNRILALGTNDEIRFLAGPKTEVLDAKGRRVLPGLIDNHTHPHMWLFAHRLGAEGDLTSTRYNDPQLKIVLAKGNDLTEVLRSLERGVRQRAQELGPGKWIFAFLFTGNSLPESRILYSLFPRDPQWNSNPPVVPGGPGATLSREFLDTLAPNNPLIVFVPEAIGPAANNTLANRETEKYFGNPITGLTARVAVLWDILLRDRMDVKLDLLKRELLECIAAQGVTTFANHYYSSASIMKVYNLLYQRGELPVRYAWWFGGSLSKAGSNADPNPDSFYSALGDFRGIGNDYIWNAGVANEGWESGDLICTVVKPRDPNSPKLSRAEGDLRRGLRPYCDDDPEYYKTQGGYRTIVAALKAGLRIGYLHHYSDGTLDALFKAAEQAMAEGHLTLEDIRAAKMSTAHSPMIRPDQVPTMAKYGIRPDFTLNTVQGDIKAGAFVKTYGEQYMSWIAPAKSLVNAGVHPVFNTDAHMYKVPVEWKDMDYPPQWEGNTWGFIEFFVTRRMPHDGITYNGGEALDRVSAMKIATIWGAENVLNEKNIGSLEVGKLADFIVIDKDYFTIPEDQIRTIKTLLTAVGGKQVFKDPNY